MRVRGPSRRDVGVEVDDAAPVDGHRAHDRAGLRRQELPRHDVRVVLELRHDDLVARGKPGTPVGLRDEVDGLGRAAHEDDFGERGRVDEAAHLLARALVERGRLLGERMHAAMHVGMVRPRVVGDRIDHDGRLLGRGGVVEVGEGMAVDAPCECGKLGADAGEVERDCGFARGGHHLRSCRRSRPGSAPATRARAASRTAATGTRPTRSRQNAYVSTARATSASRPRDSR